MHMQDIRSRGHAGVANEGMQDGGEGAGGAHQAPKCTGWGMQGVARRFGARAEGKGMIKCMRLQV